jgi:ribonucleoside-diphosphate reductase alpha chain
MAYGPKLEISEEIHKTKYRGTGESFEDAMTRVADSLKDNTFHYFSFRDILLNQRFLPAGRVQAAMGAPRQVTPYNCYVSGTINDDMIDIMDKAKEAAETMRKGGGIGYDFSTLRPRGSLIKSLDSRSSGPISFMGIYDSVCATVSSAGHRRGAQMGVLRVDHPDIEEFVNAKTNKYNLTNFNISVGVTDEFMAAVKNDSSFDLRFGGVVYRTISATALWNKILRNTWDWAEPGILFIDRINKKNNLWYCENIAASNPCGEQPLPPYGACLLGSFNLVKYVKKQPDELPRGEESPYWFDYEAFKQDIPHVVRAMDNVVDRAIYPLPQQEVEAKQKRRMGLGVTGVANAIEAMGHPYGSPVFLDTLTSILTTLRDSAYLSSVELALEKGPFPLFDERMLESEFAKTLPSDIRDYIKRYGLRNSHLLSIAPTGTISLTADNISSGIEPVFAYELERDYIDYDGKRKIRYDDYGVREFGVRGRTTNDVPVFDHVSVLNLASHYVDSACSKTCNVGDNVEWDDFKDVYLRAYEGGASGCTTFRLAGKRFGMMRAIEEKEETEVLDTPEGPTDFIEEGTACYYDPDTGQRTCE